MTNDRTERKWTRTRSRFKGGSKDYKRRCASKGKRQLGKADIDERRFAVLSDESQIRRRFK